MTAFIRACVAFEALPSSSVLLVVGLLCGVIAIADVLTRRGSR